jgi:hypothetical protein
LISSKTNDNIELSYLVDELLTRVKQFVFENFINIMRRSSREFKKPDLYIASQTTTSSSDPKDERSVRETKKKVGKPINRFGSNEKSEKSKLFGL